MEFKHFSHNHGLVFHQVPQGSQIPCSGCKSPGSGNVYVCWQCNYFLHEKCFCAARSFKHPSHPLHPLTLVPFPTYPSGSFLCNSCKLGGDGFSYSCSECEFDIHLHCALTPNPNPHVSPSPLPAPNYNSQPQNPIYPPHSATIPNVTQNSPIQPHTASYPPLPNTPFPSVNPAYPSNQHNPPPGYPQPNATPQSFTPPANAPTINPSPPPSEQNPTVPTYIIVMNNTTNPPPQPPPQPSVSQTNNPQSEPHTIIKHFSHPHLLKPMEIVQKNGKSCSACEWELSGSAYCCTESHCNFNLDKACFDCPREVRHKSHPHHPLTLLSAPPNGKNFDCYACWRSGKAFAYTCTICSIYLHIDCIEWSETVTRPDHKHPLTLHYSAAEASGEVSLTCNVCEKAIDQKAWRYYCCQCGFGIHTSCVGYEMKRQNAAVGKTEDVTDQLLRMQEQKMNLDLQMEMNRVHAQFIASMASSWSSLID